MSGNGNAAATAGTRFLILHSLRLERKACLPRSLNMPWRRMKWTWLFTP
uniref:Hydroxymethylbilane synthase n=1 Tax=Homo sapiens TaxID=9606 RepID=A0A3B3IT17_HUMAN